MKFITVFLALYLACVGVAQAYDSTYVDHSDFKFCKRKADAAGFFENHKRIERECIEKRAFENKKAEAERYKAIDAAVEEKRKKREEKELKERLAKEEARMQRAEDRAEQTAPRKAAEEKARRQQQKERADLEAQRKAEIAEQKRRDKVAKEAREAEKKAQKEMCGDDYRRVRVGMTLQRVQDCFGGFKLSSQVNRSDGVASTYRRCHGYQCGYIVVMDGKVIAWQAP